MRNVSWTDQFQLTTAGYVRAKKWLIDNGHCTEKDFEVKDGFAKVILANKLYKKWWKETFGPVKINHIKPESVPFVKRAMNKKLKNV